MFINPRLDLSKFFLPIVFNLFLILISEIFFSNNSDQSVDRL